MSRATDIFNTWYLDRAVIVLSTWRKHHPIKHHCEPLAVELHTSIKPSLTNIDQAQRDEWAAQYG